MATWFWMYLKRFVKSVSFLVAVVLIPIAVFALGGLSGQEASGIAVGLAASSDPSVKEAQRALLENEDGVVVFTVYEDEDTLERAVKEGGARIGYAFSDDLTKRVREGRNRKLITRIGDKEDIYAPLVDEIMFAQVYNALGPGISADYAAAAILPESADPVEKAYGDYERTVQPVFRFEDIEGAEIETGGQAETFPARGIAATIVLLCALFGIQYARRDEKEGLYLRLSPGSRSAATLLASLAPTLTMTLVLFACVLLAGLWLGALPEIAGGLFFAVLCVFFSAALSSCIRGRAFAVSLPIIIMLTLVFTPVFFDLGAYSPALRIPGMVSPAYWYLGIMDGKEGAPVGGFIYLGVCLLMWIIRTKSTGYFSDKRAET